MADIKDTVGGPGSQVQDVALIQMMLKVIKDAKGASYLKANYSGEWNDATKDAIVRFQKDFKLIALAPDAGKDLKGGAAAVPAGGATPAGAGKLPPTTAKLPGMPQSAAPLDKEGIVALKSATLEKLNALLPAPYKEAMILPGTKTVYFPATAEDAKANATHIGTNAELEPMFRQKAADFVAKFYQQTKIALKATKSGMRRRFQEQMDVVSQAGPGESNHQFGQAADIGFVGLRWVDGDGTIRTDTAWLNAGEETAQKKAYMPAAKAAEFWKAHHEVAFGKVGLFPTGLAGDDVHVQAYSDSSLSYSRSLAKLLNATAQMKWEGAPHTSGQQNKYKSDFGLGGKTFEVGTAKNVFGGQAKINVADVVAALNASKQDLAKTDVFKDFDFVKKALKDAKLAPGKTAPPITGAKVAFKDITGADIELLRKAAKSDWEKADKNWKTWVPVK